MINFWFRSKTSSSSRYLACLPSSGHAAARRPGAPSLPWRLQFKHLTTLFYSSIIATAAAADVKEKRARREQWNNAISEAQRLLQEVKDRSGNDEDEICSKPGGPKVNIQSTDSELTNTLLQELDDDIRTGIDRGLDMYDGRRKLPQVEERARVAPQSIYASEFRRSMRPESWSLKKLVTTELAVAKLTTRFLLEMVEADRAELTYNNTPNKSSTTALERDNLRRRLDRLCNGLQQVKKKDSNADNMDRIEKADLPKYEPNINGLKEIQGELNIAMAQIFRKLAAGKLKLADMLSKISYNLLVSQAPPNLLTWTLLISRLSRLQQHDLVDMVLEAVEEIHIRPNEMTVSATLAHYTRKKNFHEFVHYVSKLEGHHGGLMLARENVLIGVGSSRLQRRNDKIIQCITFDAHVYYNVIWGYLAFHNLPKAMIWYRRMRQDGFQADLKLLIQFLRFFSAKRDWERGLGMWKAIHNRFLSSEITSLDMSFSAEFQTAYYYMLQLCRNCQQSKYFRNVYKEGLFRGFTMEKLLLGGLVARGFRFTDDSNEVLRRTVRIFKHRVFLMCRDLRKWGLQSLASKIILRGLDLQAVQAAFEKHGDKDAFRNWLADRPWLQLREEEDPLSRLLPFAEMERGEDGFYATQKTYRFNDSTSKRGANNAKAQSVVDSSKADDLGIGRASENPSGGRRVEDAVGLAPASPDGHSRDIHDYRSDERRVAIGYINQERGRLVASFA